MERWPMPIPMLPWPIPPRPPPPWPIPPRPICANVKLGVANKKNNTKNCFVTIFIVFTSFEIRGQRFELTYLCRPDPPDEPDLPDPPDPDPPNPPDCLPWPHPSPAVPPRQPFMLIPFMDFCRNCG